MTRSGKWLLNPRKNTCFKDSRRLKYWPTNGRIGHRKGKLLTESPAGCRNLEGSLPHCGVVSLFAIVQVRIHSRQIFGVVGSNDFPLIWVFSGSLTAQLILVILVPAVLAYIFGWLAFRSRVTGVYLSILTQAFTLALSLYLFQNESGLRGNNGLSGLQNLPHVTASQDVVALWLFWASAVALGLGYIFASVIVSGKFGSVIRAIRDNEARVRFLGYRVEAFKLTVFVTTAIIASIAGALYYPQAGIVNPAEMAPIASIYLAVWVAIGGRGRLYGAVIGATSVSLLSTYFTGGQAPDITLGFATIKWVDWWQVLLGFAFVCITLFAPRGIGGAIENLMKTGARK